MIGTALSYRGTRYVYGGTTSRGGFDCSGFTRYIFSKYGISLPRTSVEQSRIGVPVSRGQLKPGDLLFFSTIRAGVSHVGIYAGNGMMVHAANPRRGVTTDSINSPYYAKRFVGARRVK
jgi:cell wall-associated NlpC family hydrolase